MASILTTCQGASVINASPHQAANAHQTDADTYNVHNLVVHFQQKATECQNSWDCYTVQQLKERFESAAKKNARITLIYLTMPSKVDELYRITFIE
jgi:hypothetical protein